MGIVIALVGLAVGSFLNVGIDRLPAGRSLLRPRSHCDACLMPLAARDLIPVLSYVLLRGRCRYCSAPIPVRLPLVEAGTAALFYVWWWRHGPSLEMALAALVSCVLILIIVIVLEHRPMVSRSRRTCHGTRRR